MTDGGFPPRTLVAAVVLVAVETTAELAYVVGRGDLRPALRALFVVLIAMKYGFAWLALRRSAGSVLALMMYEATAVLAAVAGSDLSPGARAALLINGVAVIGLLASSAHAFPAPTFPKP